MLVTYISFPISKRCGRLGMCGLEDVPVRGPVRSGSMQGATGLPIRFRLRDHSRYSHRRLSASY